MRTVSKNLLADLTPDLALELLMEGNTRFVNNLKVHRNLLQQINETREGQNPFAVIISCMDSRTSAELIFDQGLGDIFSVRIAGNVINEDILGSAEFGCKVAGVKVVLVLGHSGCGAILGTLENLELGHLGSVTGKIRRCVPKEGIAGVLSERMAILTKLNVIQSIRDLRFCSPILAQMEKEGSIKIAGAIYDVTTGIVEALSIEESAQPELLS